MTAADILAIVQRRDPDEMAATIMKLWGYVEMTKKPRKAKAVTATWLTPAERAWVTELGGTFNAGRAAKALAPLRARYSDDEIGSRLGYYLRTKKRHGETKYASLERFAESIGLYNPSEPAFLDDHP